MWIGVTQIFIKYFFKKEKKSKPLQLTTFYWLAPLFLHDMILLLWFAGFHFYVSLAHGEKHEELVTLGSPDSHTISEGQKSSGTSKIRKGKEKSSEKDKTAREKQAPRFEPQVGVLLFLIGIIHFINVCPLISHLSISPKDNTEKFHLLDSSNHVDNLKDIPWTPSASCFSQFSIDNC